MRIATHVSMVTSMVVTLSGVMQGITQTHATQFLRNSTSMILQRHKSVGVRTIASMTQVIAQRVIVNVAG
jgi:hypothetical protein